MFFLEFIAIELNNCIIFLINVGISKFLKIIIFMQSAILIKNYII
jgi:hypothetical protein